MGRPAILNGIGGIVMNESNRRVNIKQILQDPQKRKKLFVGVIQFLQNIEGIDTTKEQAEIAYDKVQEELK